MSSNEKENFKMDEAEKENLSNSFKQIVSCAVEEKKEIPVSLSAIVREDETSKRSSSKFQTSGLPY